MTLQAFQLACTRGERPLFDGIDLTVEHGDALRVAGANGSGKTSLLRILCGLASSDAGDVLWNGKSIRASREAFCRELIYLGHANSVKDDLTACENLVIVSALSGNPATQDDVYRVLEDHGLGRIADLPVKGLSQGQRKRVALARLQLGVAQPLWILDEAFTALDHAAVAALIATLDRHLADGGMVIYTTHQEVELSARRNLTLDLDRGQ